MCDHPVPPVLLVLCFTCFDFNASNSSIKGLLSLRGVEATKGRGMGVICCSQTVVHGIVTATLLTLGHILQAASALPRP
jgi:hypothetical protein